MFFLGPSRRQPRVELVRPNPVVAMHQKMTDITLCFLRSSISRGKIVIDPRASNFLDHGREI